jgi:hypothetical protein
MLLHRREVAVVVQQRVAVFNAERADDDVRGLADRYAQVSQLAIIAGGVRGEIGVECGSPTFAVRPVSLIA